MREVIRARGHDNVRAEHASTFEVTTDDWLTPAGDCIIGVEADRSPAAFAPAFVEACRDRTARITARIQVDDHTQTITGRGHPDLPCVRARSAVARTSDDVDDRTVMVVADPAAVGVDRARIESLRTGAALVFTLSVEA